MKARIAMGKRVAERGVASANRASRSARLMRPVFVLISSATLVTAVASIAHAAEPFAAPGAAAAPASPASAGSLAQVTLSLVLVLAAVFAAAWLMRRLRNFGRLGAGAIEIVADVALGAKERAVLVQVGDQQLLLGVAPGRVNTLHLLAEPVRVKRPLPGPPPHSGGGNAGSNPSSFYAAVHDDACSPAGSSSPNPPPFDGGGQGGGGARPDFKAILKRSLGL